MLLKADIIFHAGINSIMAEYHKGMWDYYDVLYVDTSYKTGMPSYGFMQRRLKYYVDENLKYDKRGWLSLSYEGSELLGVLLATDENGYGFFRKAVDATRFEKGISGLEELVSYLNDVREYTDLSDDLQQSKKEITSQIDEANGSDVIWEGESVRIDVENPLQKMESGNALLRTVVGESTILSQKWIDVWGTASHRKLAAGTIEMNEGVPDVKALESDILDKALYVEYIRTHFQNYLEQAHEKPLSYEMEYLIAGKESDIRNLEVVISKLLLIREADNYISLLTNESKKLEAHAIAAGMANVAAWLEPIIYQALLLYWAYEMSVDDLQLLFAGGEIPVVKALSFEGEKTIGLNYEEYLCLLLLLEQREKLTMRTLDLVELFIRKEEMDFHIDGCVGVAIFDGTFRDSYQKQYTITKTMEYY